MAVWRYHASYSTAGAASFHSWLSVYLTNLEAWTSGEVDNSVPTETKTVVGSDLEYYSFAYAFEWGEDPDIIWEQITQYMDAYLDWYTIGEHQCFHDEPDDHECRWERVDSGGTLPDGVSAYSRR